MHSRKKKINIIWSLLFTYSILTFFFFPFCIFFMVCFYGKLKLTRFLLLSFFCFAFKSILVKMNIEKKSSLFLLLLSLKTIFHSNDKIVITLKTLSNFPRKFLYLENSCFLRFRFLLLLDQCFH